MPNTTKRIAKLAVICIFLLALFFVLRPHVLWLDSFSGVIIKKSEKEIATVLKEDTRQLSKYYIEISTENDRDLKVLVEQLLYFEARVGMKVTKSPFSSEIKLDCDH